MLRGQRLRPPPGALLTAGQRFPLSANAVVFGREGMRDEWLNDTGVIVLAEESGSDPDFS